MDYEDMETIRSFVEYIADAITKIAHGPSSGPTGLEMVAMAMRGEGGGDGSVAGALNGIANAIDDRAADALDGIANAIDGLTEAIRNHSKS